MRLTPRELNGSAGAEGRRAQGERVVAEEGFDALMCFSALAGSRRVRSIEKGVTTMSARMELFT